MVHQSASYCNKQQAVNHDPSPVARPHQYSSQMHQFQQQTHHACWAVSGQEQCIMHASTTQMHAAVDGPSATGPQ